MLVLWLDVVAFPTFPRLPEKTLRLLIVIVLVGCRYLRIAIRHDMMYRNDPDSFKLSGIHAVYRLTAALRCNLYAVAAIRECIAIRRIAMICRRAVGTIVRGDIGGGRSRFIPIGRGGDMLVLWLDVVAFIENPSRRRGSRGDPARGLTL